MLNYPRRRGYDDGDAPAAEDARRRGAVHHERGHPRETSGGVGHLPQGIIQQANQYIIM